MAVHVDKQVFYKSLRGVHAEDKMLLYAREAVCPGIDMEPLAGQSFSESEQNYSCSSCGEMFRSKLAVLRHKAYICTNPIATYNNLKEQMTLNHHNMACSNNSATRNSNSNGNHLGNCSESDDSKSDESCQEPAEAGSSGEFKCDECPKSFHWKANLQRHLLTHAGNRKFQCENCDKLFTDPSNLQRHIRSQHVGARSHACSDCGKTFATSSGLKQHQHIHSSIKPFQCEVCLKAYTQFSNLCRHKRMHADCRQQIKCTDCGQAFSTVTSLSKHRRFCEGVTGIASPVFSNDHAPHLNSSLFTLYAAAAAAARPQFSLSSFHQMGVYQNLWAQRLPRMLGMSPVSSSGPLKLTANTTRLSPGHYLHPSLDTSIKGPKACNFLPYLDKQENSGRNSAVSDDDNDDDDDDDDISEDTSELDVSKTSDDGDEGQKYLKRTLEEPQASSRPESPNLENVIKVPKSEAGQTPQEIKPRSGNSFAPPGSTQFRPQSPEASFIDGPANSKFQSVSSGRPDKSPGLSSDDLKPEHDSSSSSSSMKTLKNDVSEVSSDSYFSHKDEVPLDLSKKPVNLTPIPRAEPQRLSQTYSEKSPSPSSSSSSSSLSPTAPSFKPHITSVSTHSLPSLSIPGLKTNIPDPLNYPFSPIFLESLLRMKEDMKLQQEAAANYSNPFTSFPVPGPSMFPRLHSQYGIPSNPDLNKVLSPTKSYESSDHAVRHQGHLHSYFGQGTQNASKEKYSCKFCGKIFPRSANLTRHLRTHTGEQPYKCKYCERSFSISSNLQRHVRNIHNKEKPFRCQLCDRCFGQQTNLDRHLKKHELDSLSLSDSTTADLDSRNIVRVSGSFAGSGNKAKDDDADNEKEVSDIVSKGIPSSYTDNSSSNSKQLFNKDTVYADEEDEVIEDEDISEVTMTR